jgi:dTDP-4-dehydrorhamnose reductase
LERVSKYQLGQALARAFGLPENLLKQGKFGDVELFAPRPREMSMATDRVTKLLGHPMPDTAASIESLSHEN